MRSETPVTRRSVLAGIGGTATLAAWPGGAIAARTRGAQLSPTLLDAVPSAGAWVELSRAAIVANVEAVRAAAGGRPIMGVVKANAYGHGLVPFARELTRAGVEALMVITVDEALALRDAGITVPVLNYGPFDRGAADELVRHDIDQAVYALEATEQMVTAGRRVGRPARVQIVFDTGLGRVGVPEREAAGLLEGIAGIRAGSDLVIAGAATALSEDPDYDRAQLARYERLVAAARAGGLDIGMRHVAASAAVLDFPASHLDMVRPGIMLYGHYPNDRSMRERPIELTPVLSWKAKVACVKTLQAGDSIGYHRAWVAQRESRVVTLPVGHSEGYPGGAPAAGGAVSLVGRACPLVGEVTSNHLEVAVPDGVAVEVGDTAVLIAGGAPDLAGAGQPASTDAAEAGTEAAGRAASDAATLGAAARQDPWLPTAPRLGEWGGAGVYGTLMHISPLLPRLIT